MCVEDTYCKGIYNTDMKMAILLIAVILNVIYSVQSCENKTIVLCPTGNMTCATAVCACFSIHGNGFGPFYPDYITCINVLEEIPEIPSASYLLIEGSNITTIKSGAFKNLSLFSLTLRESKVEKIEREAFVALHALAFLSLDRNDINDIETGAFIDLRGLSFINLSNNELTCLRTRVFVNISVGQIDLSNNKLTCLRKEVFANISVGYINLKNNSITSIESRTFYNLPSLSFISLAGSPIKTIRTDTFKDLPVEKIDFMDSTISVIESRAFNNLDKLSTLDFSRNNITEIQENAFAFLPNLQSLKLQNNALRRIEENVFSNLTSLHELIVAGMTISVIEQDAFLNVQARQLVIGIDANFVIKENIHTNLTSVYFVGNPVNCNCSFFWFVLWLIDRPQTKVDGVCKNINKSVDELVTKDFTHCYENRLQHKACNISQSVELTCSSTYLTSDFQYWIHTQNGIEIRKLSGLSVSPVTNVLSIAFCSYEDAGDYTCVRTTNYSTLPNVTFTTKLSVRGPPILLNQHVTEERDDLIMSIVFYCEPFNQPSWLLGDTILSNASEYMVSTSQYQVSMKQRLSSGFITNLTIFNYKQQLSKAYTCRIYNIYGEVKEIIISRSVYIEMDRTIYCNTSSKAEIKCSFGLNGAIPGLWVHSYNGQTIRTLPGTIVNNTNILYIPFCNYQDMGDYTCTWRTNVPDMLLLNQTTTFVVYGPPLLLDRAISRDRNDTILSVLFFSNPFPMEPKWYFQGTLVVLGYEYQQTTTFSVVTVPQHRHNIDRMGFVSQLTIVNSRLDLLGVYTCKIVNDYGYLQHDMAYEATVPNTVDESSSGNTSITIIAVISASVVFVIASISTIVFCRRRTQKKAEYAGNNRQPRVVSEVYDSIRFSQSPQTPNAYIDVC